MAETRTAIDLADLQGDILRAYGNDYDCTSYAFVTLDCPPAQARAWFAGLLPHVTTAQEWPVGSKPRTTLNVAVTAAGVRALGVPDEVIGTFSAEFREGMAARATSLGDVGRSTPALWESGLGTGQAHVLLIINAWGVEDHRRALAAMSLAMAAFEGVRIVHHQETGLLDGAREHFGHADGFAQPAIEGTTDRGTDRTRGGGVPLAGDSWRGLAVGEFVLGYPDEDTRDDPAGALPNAPASPLGRSGTYMVWRKLAQDVALWRTVLTKVAADTGTSRDLLSAKAVGRWQNGTPLVTHPDAPDPAFSAVGPGANDFRYHEPDPDGLRCPIGAHIRRSNPRDSIGWDGALTYRHRMIRRGMPFGPALPDGALSDDGVPRGLVFVSFQASISRQFEAVQLQWLNDGNIFGLGHDSDFMLGGDGTGKMTVQGSPPVFLTPQAPFVTTRGGEYLFVPGIAALGALAAGHWPA